MNPANVLIVAPRLQHEGGILAEMVQGALARCAMNVRIAASDSLGSGFADHVLIKPKWLPWFIREPLLLNRFILHQEATFGFGLLIWIFPGRRSSHTLRAFRNKISTVTICRKRDGETHGWLMQRDTPDLVRVSQWIENIIDDDIASPLYGKEHPPEVWTKNKLAEWLAPKAALGPIDSSPPPYPLSANIPKTINLDLRFG